MTNQKTLPRQTWLDLLIVAMAEEFKRDGIKLPKYRATIGLPSRGGLAARNRTIGQCWYPEASADGTTEIMVSPTQDVPLDIAQVTLHEMVHATLGAGFGHRSEFRTIATACGLVGKMTATEAGPEFTKRVTPILKRLGKLNHKKLDATIGVKKQTTRMIKVTCTNHDCGMVFRTSNKWVEISYSHLDCPLCHTYCDIG